MKTFLHVGCGTLTKQDLKGFDSPEWQEVRFDIDPKVKPDIIGTLEDMSAVPDASVDAIYSSHNIEHVYAYQVPRVLQEFRRVLRADGFGIVTCPDLQSVAEHVVRDELLTPLYVSPMGPITPMDVMYGHTASIAHGNEYMSHRCGFTFSALTDILTTTGFVDIVGGRRPEHWDLWVLFFKTSPSAMQQKILSHKFLP